MEEMGSVLQVLSASLYPRFRAVSLPVDEIPFSTRCFIGFFLRIKRLLTALCLLIARRGTSPVRFVSSFSGHAFSRAEDWTGAVGSAGQPWHGSSIWRFPL